MNKLTADQAKLALGESIQLLVAEGSSLTLTLTSVTDAKPTPDFPGKIREPFSMIFKGTKGRYCPQGVYTIHSEHLGDQQIHLVPIGHDAATDMYIYQAVFN